MEFQLRKNMLDYIDEMTPILTRYLKEWNEKMIHGIPIGKSFWYDLFGRNIKLLMEPKTFFEGSVPDGILRIFIAPYINEDNPFQVLFVYRVETIISTTREHSVEYFSIGEEHLLLEYCEERGIE
ncbi:hypothetical protein [Cytobacillus oceanisediminis]|uniref:hypothetical protein n=1 Tax=Cytobacillus oceanisediminis TaxID=665099 RepID=UPI001FB4A307|nr:hypothetical protein [Cytobacillus oceanisediminis]UOE58198.1 hypothetical protein IRB79_27230 [Cytobacillus oceanisediminis]